MGPTNPILSKNKKNSFTEFWLTGIFLNLLLKLDIRHKKLI